MSESNQDKSICPHYGHELPQDNGKPKIKLIDGKWRRYCKECGWYERP